MSTALTIRVSVRWWVRPYMVSLMLFAAITGLQPDADRAAALIARRGIVFTPAVA